MKKTNMALRLRRQISSKDLQHLHLQNNTPILKSTADLIYKRAQGLSTLDSFGSAIHTANGQEFILPAITKAEFLKEQPRILIGGKQCKQPYSASILNASALPFGPIGKPFLMALNQAAYHCGFFQNTGQVGISPYHVNVDIDIEAPDFNCDKFFEDIQQKIYPESKQAGDIVWQISADYFGCRQIDGSFDQRIFQQKAFIPNVKMIELKLSQGVEPLKQMPVKEVTPGMIKLMGINWEDQAKSSSQHSKLRSPLELLEFVREMRELSNGKPIGIKMGISHRHYFLSICKAMLKTGILLDFVTVDGMEGGTAAALGNTLGVTGTPLKDAVLFVHNALVGTNLRDQIKVIASGQVFTEVAIFSILARGADICATARGFLLSTGCDQQQECYNGSCLKGIATQNPELLKNFNIDYNIRNICNYHQLTIQAFQELMSLTGITSLGHISPALIQRRHNDELKPLNEIYEFLKEGSLLSLTPWSIPRSYRQAWVRANPNKSFCEM